MAMEYIYIEQDLNTQPTELKNFKGLRYIYRGGALELVDERGKQKALFQVEERVCYVLQRRNQSALQLHRVTPPSKCVERIPWLFGFNRSHRCDSEKDFYRVCREYQQSENADRLRVRNIDGTAAYLAFAFANNANGLLPVAYYSEQYDGTAWAFYGEETVRNFVERLHGSMGQFKYPLQYAVRIFQGAAMFYPNETKEFFQEKLGYGGRKDVCYV